MARTTTQLYRYFETIIDRLIMHMEGMIFQTELSFHITKGTLLQTEDY